MTSAGSVYLIDTNVLIYAYDSRDPAKQRRAIEVLTALEESQSGALTVQVLSEFYFSVTRKKELGISPEQARASTARLGRAWPVFDLTLRVHHGATRAVEQHRLSFWDAMIWATAMENSVPYVLTEDQQHGRLVEDVRYLDPFQPDFDPAAMS